MSAVEIAQTAVALLRCGRAAEALRLLERLPGRIEIELARVLALPPPCRVPLPPPPLPRPATPASPARAGLVNPRALAKLRQLLAAKPEATRAAARDALALAARALRVGHHRLRRRMKEQDHGH